MDGQIVIGTEIDTKNFELEIREMEKQLEGLEWELEHKKELNLDDRSVELTKIKVEKLTNQLVALKKKQDDVNNAKMSGMGEALEGISGNISKVIKKVAKWSLALIGVRSVYLGLRQAMSIITSYDEKLKTDVDYFKYALANSLKPIIEWIINAFYQVLAIIGYIVKLISGKNIFEKSGASQFKKDMNGANKSAKELKKTLTSFDEANVLQDNKDKGAGGVGTPSKDLAKMVDEMSSADIDKIWEDISKAETDARKSLLSYQDELHNTLSNTKAFEDAYGIWATFVHGIGTIWEGIIDVVSGVWDTIKGLFGMFIDIISGNFDKLGEDFSLFITGILEILGGLGEIVLGIIETIFGAIIGVLGELAKWIWDELIVPIGKWFADVGKAIGNAFVSAWEWIKGVWNGAINLFKSIATGIASAFKSAVDKVKGFFTGLWDGIKNGIRNVATTISSIVNGFKSGVKGVINFFIDGINKFIKGMNKIQWDVPDWVPFIGGQKWGINIPEVPRLAQGGIVNMPNKGVMVGSAIAGESGREGVVPLTDPNAMAQLGKEIGQWINIGIDNKMVVDGRVLATATQDRINKESFLMNR